MPSTFEGTSGLWFGFLDEAGDVGFSKGSSRYLVVAISAIADANVLRRAVKKIRQSFAKKLRDIPELKAAQTPTRIVQKLLRCIVQFDVEIFAVIVDKQKTSPPVDLEKIYRDASAMVIKECLTHHPNLLLFVDKRHTNPRLREKFNQAIVQAIQDINATVAIEHLDSRNEKGLQVADAVAYTLWAWYEREEHELYSLIEGKIVSIKAQ